MAFSPLLNARPTWADLPLVVIFKLAEPIRSDTNDPSGRVGSNTRPIVHFLARFFKKEADFGEPISSSGLKMISQPTDFLFFIFSKASIAVSKICNPPLASMIPGP